MSIRRRNYKMNEEEKYIGYFKYKGESVKDGLLDARKMAEALVGFDEIMRYFLHKEDPHLSKIDFEIPVRIRKGCIEFLLPKTLEQFLVVGAGAGALVAFGTLGSYMREIAKVSAKDGLLETGPVKDLGKIFKGVLITIQWVVKIASHIGEFKKIGDGVKAEKHEQDILDGIKNNRGELLQVPRRYVNQFNECPKKLFEKNVKIIEEGRILEIGVFEKGDRLMQSISETEKYIFCSEKKKEDDAEIVLPDLRHGQFVELEGEITRAIENQNSIGFLYHGQIIICKPAEGSIAAFKGRIVSKQVNQFFPKVQIKGQIDRADSYGNPNEKRPKILFNEINPLESNDREEGLLF